MAWFDELPDSVTVKKRYKSTGETLMFYEKLLEDIGIGVDREYFEWSGYLYRKYAKGDDGGFKCLKYERCD